ncbi:repeat protein [Moumouvirus goulette]|uniref:Repeat protein n=1 Tax=Moumouvirus goulette TaxID=1247379 RepID=M1PM22_9VIRU|nr:repeat protein [Moumouvirus goulette]AGF84966.1 repeat protein [Moumouvirus goulette]
MGINYSTRKSEYLPDLILSKEDEYYVDNIRNYCEKYPERINECTIPFATGLFYACGKNTNRDMTDIVRMLIDYGADVNKTDDLFSVTPLMAACSNHEKVGNPNIIKLLIERGANINIQDSEGNTALMRECFVSKNYNNENIIKILVVSGADRNIQNKKGQTAKDIIHSHYDENYLHTIEKIVE